ncbi:MAG: glycosyltransferase family protein [Reyranellaceae bacterium]
MNERRNGAAKSTGRDKRVLIYSHDSFGLGHLSRCRTIANWLVAQDKNLSVLILSGSPLIGSFDFRARVDFVRIPGVIKLRNGEYTSLNLLIDIEETLHMRASIIQHTADIFDPDLFLVDKEPLGLRGEVTDTLKMLKKRGTPLVLGLRDVMDEPMLLEPEWQRKNVVPALRDLYDDIWVYGLPQMCDPVAGIALPKSVRRKITYTGYLRRELPREAARPALLSTVEQPYILVTAGGGGDGEALIDWVLRAYEQDPNIPYDAVIVFGPFMNPQRQKDFRRRVEAQPKVHTLTFESNLATLMDEAAGVVAMGGYNTFCEILSFDKRALIVPRTQPRLEQYIRASAARALGLANMLPDDGERDPQVMATALRQLPQQSLPSEVVIPGLLDGLASVNRLVRRTLAARPHRPSPVETARKRA